MATTTKKTTRGPELEAHQVIISPLITEKAVYEVVYETRMRPPWAVLPLAAVERLSG